MLYKYITFQKQYRNKNLKDCTYRCNLDATVTISIYRHTYIHTYILKIKINEKDGNKD